VYKPESLISQQSAASSDRINLNRTTVAADSMHLDRVIFQALNYANTWGQVSKDLAGMAQEGRSLVRDLNAIALAIEEDDLRGILQTARSLWNRKPAR
jgi:hypothetical protein